MAKGVSTDEMHNATSMLLAGLKKLLYIVSSLFHASFLNTERARLRITITLVANRAWPHIEIEISWVEMLVHYD